MVKFTEIKNTLAMLSVKKQELGVDTLDKDFSILLDWESYIKNFEIVLEVIAKYTKYTYQDLKKSYNNYDYDKVNYLTAQTEATEYLRSETKRLNLKLEEYVKLLRS